MCHQNLIGGGFRRDHCTEAVVLETGVLLPFTRYGTVLVVVHCDSTWNSCLYSEFDTAGTRLIFIEEIRKSQVARGTDG